MYSLSSGEIGEENVLSVLWGDWRRKCTLCPLGRLAKKMYSLSSGEIGEENVLSVPLVDHLSKKMYSLSPEEIGGENVLSAPPTPTPSATPALSLDQLDLTVFDMDLTVFDMDLTVFDIQYNATLLSA